MFPTSYVHLQEGYILHAALYGMFSMRLYKQSTRLKEVLDKLNHQFQNCIVLVNIKHVPRTCTVF